MLDGLTVESAPAAADDAGRVEDGALGPQRVAVTRPCRYRNVGCGLLFRRCLHNVTGSELSATVQSIQRQR